MSSTTSLRQLLDLEQPSRDTFVGITPASEAQRLYGGIVAGQSMRAACATVPDDRRAHSLHAYFLRPGVPGVALELTVERLRDGRSFTTRHVTARQGSEAIFVLTASFHVDETGEEWQPGTAPVVPGPDEVGGGHPLTDFPWPGLLDVRPAAAVKPGEEPPLHPCWVRAVEPLGDDPALQVSAMAFISDLGMLRGSAPPFALGSVVGASVDHAVWLHRPVSVDHWLLISSVGVVNHGARGLIHGSIHDRHGVLMTSMSQEGLLRPIT